MSNSPQTTHGYLPRFIVRRASWGRRVFGELSNIANEIAGRGRKKLLCKLSRVGYTITNVNKFSYIFFGIMIGCVRSINGL